MANLHPDYSGFKLNTRQRKLSLKEKKAIAEYIRTGNKSAAMRAAYNGKEKYVTIYANAFFKKPKIKDALEKALKESKFDDAYAVASLKEIIDSGLANKELTRPDTSLKGLETYWKLTNRIGGGNKEPMRMDPETVAKKMDTSQLIATIKEMDKRQKRLLELIKNGNQSPTQEGEIVK